LFFAHNFGYRYARKRFKGSKDANFGLVSRKILNQNNGPMGWGPGPGKGGQKKQKHPHLWRSPQRTPNQKRKVFVSISSRRLAESVEGLNSSLAQSPGQLWPKECVKGKLIATMQEDFSCNDSFIRKNHDFSKSH